MKLVSLKSAANAHSDGIWAVAWADSGRLLLTGSADESVKIWKGDELELERSQGGHSLGVVALAVSPDGSTAASTSLDSLVRVFDVASNETLATLESKPAEAWQLQFHPKGDLLAVAGGGSGSVNLWRCGSWSRGASVPISTTTTTAVDTCSSGGAGGGGGAKSKFIVSVAWSPDGRRLACSAMDGTIAVVDVERGKVVHTLEGHAMPVRSLAFSPSDPRLLFTACDDGHIHMYDAEAGKGAALVAALSGHASWVLCLDVTPDGAAIASASSDRTVRLWDVKMRSSLQCLTDHKDQVWGLAFRPRSSSGTRLATVSDDRSIYVYDYV